MFTYILKNGIKVILVDDFRINKDGDLYLLIQLAKYLDFIWVVPSSEYYIEDLKEKLEGNFEVLDVSLNFGKRYVVPEKKVFYFSKNFFFNSQN